MLARDKIARIAVPATLTTLTLILVAATVATMHTVVTAAPGDTETMGTFSVIGVMSLVCAAGTGFLARVSVDDARNLA